MEIRKFYNIKMGKKLIILLVLLSKRFDNDNFKAN
jgi:hypothetical protein